VQIAELAVAGICHGSRGVQLAQATEELLIGGPRLRRLAGALVEDAPDDDAGVIDRRGHHLVNALELRGDKGGVGEVLHLGLPRRRLLPDENAELVAEVEKARVLRVMAAAHEIAVQCLDELDVGQHDIQRDRLPEFGVRLVAVDAAQADRLVVQQDLAPGHAHGAQPDPLDLVVISQPHLDGMQMR